MEGDANEEDLDKNGDPKIEIGFRKHYLQNKMLGPFAEMKGHPFSSTFSYSNRACNGIIQSEGRAIMQAASAPSSKLMLLLLLRQVSALYRQSGLLFMGIAKLLRQFGLSVVFAGD